MLKNLAIGIDLGTTYSCVSVFRNGKAEIICNDQGNNTTPSWVSFSDEKLVGESAKLQQSRNIQNTIYDIKRLIGKPYDDENNKNILKHMSYNVVNNNNKTMVNVKYKNEDKLFSPEEISAFILTKMKETAEAYLGEKVSQAVITVPAYFNDSQRQATKDAGLIAGLDVLRIINEPTAAAIAYGLEKKTDKETNIIVFDCGGGTHDVSLLTIDNGLFEVKATAGNSYLGGEDIDNILVDFLKKEFLNLNKVELTQIKSLKRLKDQVEKCKRILSSSNVANIEIDSLQDGIDFNYTLSRAKLEQLCDDFFNKTLEPVERVLKDANMSKSQIDEIVLVGGTTRIPKIQQLLSQFFNNKELCKSINPDEAVAYGAAVQAAILTKYDDAAINDILLLDVCPLSLGVETSGQIMTVIIPRNTTIPIQKKQTFSTYVDNQPECTIQVYQGERKFTKDCQKLGQFNLSGLPKMPRGVPQIEITYDVDANGILNVSAVEKSTNKSESITIKNEKNSLSKEDIERMVNEAEKFKQEDQEKHDKLESLNNYEQLLYSIENKLKNHTLNDDELTLVNETVDEHKKWFDEHKHSELSKNEVDERFNKLSQFIESYKEKFNQENKPSDNMDDMMKGMDMGKMQEMMKGMNPSVDEVD